MALSNQRAESPPPIRLHYRHAGHRNQAAGQTQVSTVTTLHSAVHLIALRDLKQAQAESIRAFIARARSTASNCGLSKACAGCQEEVSFVEETLFGVVLAGLFDGNIQQKILSLADMKTITTLEQLATYVAAEESGKSERGQLGTSYTLAGLRRQSTYKARHQSLDKPSVATVVVAVMVMDPLLTD